MRSRNAWVQVPGQAPTTDPVEVLFTHWSLFAHFRPMIGIWVAALSRVELVDHTYFGELPHMFTEHVVTQGHMEEADQ